MEASVPQLAQLGATFLQYAIENPQFEHEKDSPFFTLLRSLSQGNGVPASVEASGRIDDHQANAPAASVSEFSELPSTSNVTHVATPVSKAWISRALVNRSFTFTESDLFRSDRNTLRDQYLRWRHICAEDYGHGSILERIVAGVNRLSMLKNESIGSIPLEMTYYYLFSQFRQYKLGDDVASLTNTDFYDTILRRLHAEGWDHLSDRARHRHRDKLRCQVLLGRRWAVTIGRLSHGVVLLAGKKISSLM
jgi:hypothetical protein